ncbi:MAG: cytochrome b/b6 domain-containing protein [Rhodanobacteraceae bacterium]
MLIRRHTALVRITHWINFLCLAVLLGSGLGIFNGWPALYWGQATVFTRPLLAMYALPDGAGGETGITQIGQRKFTTTGWFGLSSGADGQPVVRGFPAWATIPGPLSLALARSWHFFFAWIFVINGAVYAAFALASRHLWRDLVPSLRQLRGIGGSIRDHLRLRFPKGEAARHYNVVQKISYLVVMFGMLPLMVATGLTMSPWMDAAWPWLLDVFGGRQSARTIHFVTAIALLLFFLVHVAMVLLAGPWNELRSMVTGRYRIADAKDGNDVRT